MLNRVLEAQKNDEKISSIVKLIGDGKETEFMVKEDGSLYYKDKVCVPNDCELKKAILEEALGTRLNFNTTFHPQTDGQSERVIQILEDMLRSCVIDYEGSWDRHIPLVEFVYNNSFQSSIRMAPYGELYGRKCRTPLCLPELKERK